MRETSAGIVLSKAEHLVLVEALRRRCMFNDRKQALTEQWTGLGTAGEYKVAWDNGLMVPYSKNPRNMVWWTLTAKGASIVAYWLGQGHTAETLQTGLPGLLIPLPGLLIPRTVI